MASKGILGDCDLEIPEHPTPGAAETIDLSLVALYSLHNPNKPYIEPKREPEYL